MNKEEIIRDIRSGEGELRPVIIYYADTGDISELSEYIDDKECVSTILYIVSELPMSRIPIKMINKVEEKLRNGNLSARDALWAQDILDSDEYYKRKTHNSKGNGTE